MERENEIDLKRESILSLQPREPDRFEAALDAMEFIQSRFTQRDLVEKRMRALLWMKQNGISHITQRERT